MTSLLDVQHLTVTFGSKEGVPVVNVDTRVRYFPGGISHFDVLWDDLRLAWLYTRLAIGAFTRAPRLLARRNPQPQ